MPHAITLEVSHSSQVDGRIEGFRFLWAYYVSGYRSDKHCQPCFLGKPVAEFSSKTASVASPVALDQMARYPYVYICGVAAGPISERAGRNLHLPLRSAEGEIVDVVTYNGYRFRAQNAVRVPIPPLADDWNGLDREHARCRNFQFAVAQFGYPSLPRAAGLEPAAD